MVKPQEPVLPRGLSGDCAKMFQQNECILTIIILICMYIYTSDILKVIPPLFLFCIQCSYSIAHNMTVMYLPFQRQNVNFVSWMLKIVLIM